MGRRVLSRNSNNLAHYHANSPRSKRNGVNLNVKMNGDEKRAVCGTCMAMCPGKELSLREKENLIHRFEVLEGTLHHKCPRGDPNKTVKAYSRPAAGRVDPTPSDLRPPGVLLSTVDYLINKIVCRQDCRWTDVYEFVSDRLRAVRQDLIIQSVAGSPVIKILENTVLFHIYAGYRLCMEPVEVFVPTLNNNQIQESLKWLLSQYQESPGYHSNRVLFESMYLLYNLGNDDALRHFLQLEKSLRSDPLLHLCYQTSVAFSSGNYVRVMRLVRKMTNIQCQLAVHKHFIALKRLTLRVMSAGYNSKNLRYPVKKITELLPFNDNTQDCINLCRASGFSVLDGKVQFLRGAFLNDVEIKPSHCEFIDSQLKSTRLQDIFIQHEEIENDFKNPKQVQMSLPKKFSRLKIDN